MSVKKKRISTSFQQWLSLIVGFAFMLTLAFLWGYQTKLFTDSAENLLSVYIKDVRDTMLADPSEKALFVNVNGARMSRQGFWKILKHYLIYLL